MNDNIGIYDDAIGENIIRQATDEEQEIINEQRRINTQAREKRLLEAEEKAKAKAALLERLGMTQDEANLLLS